MVKDLVCYVLGENLQKTYLTSSQSISLILVKISAGLVFIINKRPTVAQKAIKQELTYCAELEKFLLDCFDRSLKEQIYCLSESNCLQLIEINIKLEEQLQAFINAANYNFNYLEQYFEHDFWLALDNCRYTEKLFQLKNLYDLRSTKSP